MTKYSEFVEDYIPSSIEEYFTKNLDPGRQHIRKKKRRINENTEKFHEPDCSSVDDIKEKNKREFTGTRDELIEEGYEPCGICKP